MTVEWVLSWVSVGISLVSAWLSWLIHHRFAEGEKAMGVATSCGGTRSVRQHPMTNQPREIFP